MDYYQVCVCYHLVLNDLTNLDVLFPSFDFPAFCFQRRKNRLTSTSASLGLHVIGIHPEEDSCPTGAHILMVGDKLLD